LVIIADKKSAYNEVRSGPLNKANLRRNSDFCQLQHKQIRYFSRHEKYLLRGTDWDFK